MTEHRRASAPSMDFVVPAGIRDPRRPSGGNTYDRRVIDELPAVGWPVREHEVAGAWPWPDAADETALAHTLAGLDDDAVVVVDGLIASSVPAVLAAEAWRLRLVVLVHLPLGDGALGHEPSEAAPREHAALAAARAVVTTSAWTRHHLLERYDLHDRPVCVAEPGVDVGVVSRGSGTGTALLCVAQVTPRKGQDVLLAALARLADRSARCVCVGALDMEPAYVEQLRRFVTEHDLNHVVCFDGPRAGADLERRYDAADVLVLPSRAEPYGMVVTEALARGLPVIATSAGGVPEALGATADGERPGLLVPPDDPDVLATALRRWLGDHQLREQLRDAALNRRTALPTWPDTARSLAAVLTGVAT